MVPDHGKPALAATALMLARTLDEGSSPTTATVARELRLTLTELSGPSDDEDGAFDELIRRLSAPVRDESESSGDELRSSSR